MINPDQIRTHLLQKARQRGVRKSLCPSEVARDLGGDTWRQLMPQVRQAGQQLAQEGKIWITQKGQLVDPTTAKGPIRYRLSEDGIRLEDRN